MIIYGRIGVYRVKHKQHISHNFGDDLHEESTPVPPVWMIYVTGDFNIDFSDKGSAAFRELDFTMKSLGLKQLVREPTRIAFRQGTSWRTILDLMFTNSEVIS